jgi:hypothetical protein
MLAWRALCACSGLSLIFIDGKMKHLVYQFVGLEAGAFTDIEVPIFDEAFKKWRLKGSIDAADVFNGIGVELKSTMAFSYFVGLGKPGDKHILQVHSYFEGRDDLDVFCVVYWDTTTREWKEYVVYRQKQYMTLVRNELERLNEAVDHKELPHVQQECKAGKGKTFHDCGYSHICLQTVEYEHAEAIAEQPVILSPPRKSSTSVQGGGRDAVDPEAPRRTRRVRRRSPRT